MSQSHGRMADYTHAPIVPLFFKTALPIVFLMSVNGLFTVVDAIFLGWFVGPDALAGVTLMFPLVMIFVALASLVANGMASVMARQLGAEDLEAARASFAGAHGLSALTCLILLFLFLIGGAPLVALAANGSENLSEPGYRYLLITVIASPLAFAVGLQTTALRVEGWVGFMAGIGVLVTVANIALNYVLIALLGWGVAGSAIGSAVAQAVGLVIVLIFRMRGETPLPAFALPWTAWRTGWKSFLALGAPQSLSFLGLSLGSGTIIIMVQATSGDSYETVVAAYGIAMRLLSFSFLGLMGMAQALQAMIGNNYGAGRQDRVAQSLRLGVICGLFYAASAEAIFHFGAQALAGMFVEDPAVIAEVGRILPVIVAAYVLAGPAVMISTHFQAIGDAPRAAILSLSRTYLFAIPLTLTLPVWLGEWGVWVAGPTAEVLMLGLTLIVLTQTARTRGYRFGLIPKPATA
ncbi:MATE family efflux transporter [Maricaulis parjimensis]|uniref:MATE family efflux transporter n=1 Tax=Maricaulis parjimensis TaxID=144023 RepID=UPI00193A8B19|nr:MATE family efflux transporter [Maricaulis parjimensis]